MSDLSNADTFITTLRAEAEIIRSSDITYGLVKLFNYTEFYILFQVWSRTQRRRLVCVSSDSDLICALRRESSSARGKHRQIYFKLKTTKTLSKPFCQY